MSPEDAVSLGAVWKKADGPAMPGELGEAMIHVTPSDVQDRLHELLQQGKATVLSAPRVSAINNLQASAAVTKAMPAVVGIEGNDGQFKPLFTEQATGPALNSQKVVSVGTTTKFAVTPTINNDGTITLFLNPTSTLQLSKGADSIPLKTMEGLATIVNIKDGNTVAITGLTSRFFTGEQDEKKPVSKIVLLVSAHIIKRAGG